MMPFSTNKISNALLIPEEFNPSFPLEFKTHHRLLDFPIATKASVLKAKKKGKKSKRL
jgi:hypothetical protein